MWQDKKKDFEKNVGLDLDGYTFSFNNFTNTIYNHL